MALVGIFKLFSFIGKIGLHGSWWAFQTGMRSLFIAHSYPLVQLNFSTFWDVQSRNRIISTNMKFIASFFTNVPDQKPKNHLLILNALKSCLVLFWRETIINI